jgi:hypothetical protein
MSRRLRNSMGLALALTAAFGLVGSGAGAGAVTRAPRAHASVASTPKLKVTISKKHFTVSGPRTFQAGRVALTLAAHGSEREVEVASLKKGYTFKDVRADLAAFGSKAGSGPNGSTPKSALKHLNRAINNTHLYGGLDAEAGQTERGTVVLAKPGIYYIFSDEGLPSHPTKLTVTGPAVKRAAPGSSATVTALTTRRFGGAKTLPAKGTITFKNKSTESPHFLDLIHVKKGTTRQEVLTYLLSGVQSPPPFGLQGQAATDAVGEGSSMTLSYSLPKGEYIEVCFFPDPKTGMPHALMGMIGVVTLK